MAPGSLLLSPQGIHELKVFVDLAFIFAGENDMDVDRVAYFHDAVQGYTSLLYDLDPSADFRKFMSHLKELWKALENDPHLPTKLVSLGSARGSAGPGHALQVMLAAWLPCRRWNRVCRQFSFACGNVFSGVSVTKSDTKVHVSRSGFCDAKLGEKDRNLLKCCRCFL